jgi:hypothetical protein
MPNLPRITVKVLRHGRTEVDDLTDDVLKVEWFQSISAPWQSLTVTWKATVGDSFTRVMEGDWIDFRITSASAQNTGVLSAGLLHVDSTSGGIGVSPIGGVSTQPCVFKATSWWNFLSTVNIYSVLGWTEDVGTVFSMPTWSKLISTVVTEYTAGALGKAFTDLFKQIVSKIKLPLNGTFNGQAISNILADRIWVVTDDALFNAAWKYRPVESIDIGGGSPTRIQSAMGAYENSVVDFFTGTFVPEPMLIELFPSFEPLAPQTAPGASGVQGSQSSSQNWGVTNEYFGGHHTLILRMKPFRDKPLREAAVAHVAYKHDEVERAYQWELSQLAADGNSNPDEATKAAANVRAQEAAARIDYLKTAANAKATELLDNAFEQVTWDYTTLTNIDTSLVRSMTWSRDDRNRINCSSIKLSFDEKSGIEGVLGAGLPITYDEEIARHGLRLSKPTWTYNLNISKKLRERALENKKRAAEGQKPLPIDPATSAEGGDWVTFMRTICAQFMQFYKNNHMYLKGTISLNLTEAITNEGISPVVDKVLMLRHGEGFAMSLDRKLDVIYGYCETIGHTFSIRDGGIEAASTTIEYSRGHVGVSADALSRDTLVPLREPVAPKPRTQNARGSKFDGKQTPVSTGSILIAGNDYGYTASPPGGAFRYLINYDEVGTSGYYNRKSSDFNAAIIHYDAGSVYSTAVSLKDFFQKSIDDLKPKDGTSYVSSHFGIDPNGAIYQYADLDKVVYHGGVPGYPTNAVSVGIDLICPEIKFVDTPEKVAKAKERGWVLVENPVNTVGGVASTGFKVWKWSGSKYVNETTKSALWVPSQVQLNALAILLGSLNRHVGFPLIATKVDGYDTRYNMIVLKDSEMKEIFKEKGASGKLGKGGVYHHRQIYSNRYDALGTDLYDVVNRAKNYK